MKIEAVSFDADGTLLGTFTDRERGFETFFLEAAGSRGKALTAEELRPILSRVKRSELRRRQDGFKAYVNEENTRSHWLWFYEEVFAAMGFADADEMALFFLRRYESGEFTSLYPDTLPCLEALASRGIPMILISNFSPLLGSFLVRWNIARFFQSVFISGVEGIEKPDSALFERGARALSLDPGAILHVGNELVEDYEGAAAAGFRALLLDRDGIYAKAGVKRIRSLCELPKLLA